MITASTGIAAAVRILCVRVHLAKSSNALRANRPEGVLTSADRCDKTGVAQLTAATSASIGSPGLLPHSAQDPS